MRSLRTIVRALGVVATLTGGATALAAGIDPATTKLPWMNGTDGQTQYFFAEQGNKVHVLEVYSLNCSWCNKNAPQVAALAAEFGADTAVRFLDLGVDQRDADYARWIQAHHPAYPVVKDVGRAVFNALREQDGVPQTFVLNCKGELVDSTIGFWGEGEIATLRDAIARAKETTCD